MKILILLIALIAFGMAHHIHEEDGNIKFNVDLHEESPIGFAVKGQINPVDDTQNKIGAFVKLANEYIPILENLSKNKAVLEYQRRWQINFIPGIDITVYWFFDLIVGWIVEPGDVAENFYEVTYTPFVWGSTYGRTNGTTWPAAGYFRIGVEYVDFRMPTSFTLYRDGRVCFDSFYTVNPVHLSSQFGGALRECKAEIIDEVLNQQPIHLGCAYTNDIDVQFLDEDLTNRIERVILGETCIGF
ncbi:unnamed protein product [Moneuplotes crassus]|uniref:Uncharacterized protein n=1 Tax=Euplotes crassus TaxID=5936 RepID=A0AAD1XRZ1_EUPCR|nr:unnamed protein product [Moneuplotes crassus]